MEARLLHFYKEESDEEWKLLQPAGSGLPLSARQIAASPLSVLEHGELPLEFWQLLDFTMEACKGFQGW